MKDALGNAFNFALKTQLSYLFSRLSWSPLLRFLFSMGQKFISTLKSSWKVEKLNVKQSNCVPLFVYVYFRYRPDAQSFQSKRSQNISKEAKWRFSGLVRHFLVVLGSLNCGVTPLRVVPMTWAPKTIR